MITQRRRTVAALPPALAALLLLAGSLAAYAATPPGHPSPADAYGMMQPRSSAPGAMPVNTGQVVSAIHANEYTYVEVSNGDGTRWIAGPRTSLSQGDIVRFDDGVIMKEFYSKLLGRTFPTVMFVSGVYVTPADH